MGILTMATKRKRNWLSGVIGHLILLSFITYSSSDGPMATPFDSHARLLIINADDFGYCPERNRGILEGFLSSGVSSATMIVNAVASQDAADKVKANRLPTGLHFNLIEGKPISANSPSLVDLEGWFFNKTTLRQRLLEGKIQTAHIRNEVQAQISEFQRLVGNRPTHVDGHQHTHLLQGIREVFSEVLLRNEIDKARHAAEIGFENATWVPPSNRYREDLIRTIEESKDAKIYFESVGIKLPDEFCGMATMFDWMTPDRLKSCITRAFQNAENSKPAGQVSVELMVHPGYPSRPGIGGCGKGPDEFSLSPDRKRELDILVSKEMLDWYSANNIIIGGFPLIDVP